MSNYKTIGATRHDTSWQSFFEAVTLTLFGGVAGVVLGVAVSRYRGTNNY